MVWDRVAPKLLTYARSFRARRLIVFLTPGYNWRAGGILSIVAIYRESAALRNIHNARVALCTVPGEPRLDRYTWFKNRHYILNLESLLERCGHLDYLLLHIPEYAVNRVLDWIDSSPAALLNVENLHLNVMLQNIEQIQGQDISGLKRFGKVTCTTAHEAYTNLSTRARVGVSLHRLGILRGPELYSVSRYADKDPLLIVSHDAHPLKEALLVNIGHEFPDMKIKVIENISYEDYRELAARAKWSLTFGEGLDSYFADVVLSGGVSFAVFNDRFFTPPFATLPTVYSDWEALEENIVTDIQRLDEPLAYHDCWQDIYELLGEIYSTDRFRENLRRFYRGEYTFP